MSETVTRDGLETPCIGESILVEERFNSKYLEPLCVSEMSDESRQVLCVGVVVYSVICKCKRARRLQLRSMVAMCEREGTSLWLRW